jgi:hypothetical protein
VIDLLEQIGFNPGILTYLVVQPGLLQSHGQGGGYFPADLYLGFVEQAWMVGPQVEPAHQLILDQKGNDGTGSYALGVQLLLQERQVKLGSKILKHLDSPILERLEVDPGPVNHAGLRRHLTVYINGQDFSLVGMLIIGRQAGPTTWNQLPQAAERCRGNRRRGLSGQNSLVNITQNLQALARALQRRFGQPSLANLMAKLPVELFEFGGAGLNPFFQKISFPAQAGRHPVEYSGQLPKFSAKRNRDGFTQVLAIHSDLLRLAAQPGQGYKEGAPVKPRLGYKETQKQQSD